MNMEIRKVATPIPLLTGIIDPPVDITNTVVEIVAWRVELINMPMSAQRALALEHVEMLLLIKGDVVGDVVGDVGGNGGGNGGGEAS